MADETQGTPTPSSDGGGMMRIGAAVVAVLYVIVSGYFMYDMNHHLNALEDKQTSAQEKLERRMAEVESNQKATAETLAAKLGMTEKELSERTAALQRSQKASENRITSQTKEQLGEVSGQVESVKSEVGGVKTDVASTKTDLEATKAKLERTIGDLGLQSGLIAHTRDELDALKRRGERNYYEFTLVKNAKTPVGSITLQLKKADVKKSKFTMNVIADDRTIEKKDRTLYEPMQFYTGRDKMLYEVVVNDISKDKVVGYLATPKTAQVAVQ